MSLWPKTSFLVLRVPAPYLLDYREKVEEAMGDQIEALGKNARVVVAADDVGLVSGDLVGLSNTGAGTAGSIVNGMTVRAAGGEVMVDLLGLRSTQGLAPEPLVPGQPIQAGDFVSSGAATRAVGVAIGSPVSVSATAARTVQNHVGFAVAEDAMIVNGSDPLTAERSFLTRRMVIDDGGLGVGSIGWDATNKRARARLDFTVASQTANLVWPLHIPADFESFDVEDDVEPFAFSYRVEQEASVRLNIIDSLGNESIGAQHHPTPWTAYELTKSRLDSLTFIPNTVCHLRVAIDAGTWPMLHVSEFVEVEAFCRVRYKSKRVY